MDNTENNSLSGQMGCSFQKHACSPETKQYDAHIFLATYSSGKTIETLSPSYFIKLHKEMNYLQCTLSDRSKSVLFKFSRNFTSWSRSRSFFISLSLLDLDFQSFSFHFHFSISISSHFFSLALLEKSEWHFFFTFHFSTVQNPLSQGIPQ